ncbi:2OG-Fe dioxygenase family protein [Actinoplanes sp. TBRC 11911]|uniref:2OG-Fe dioxygenase family protein n=1 Tax=Actinoplanes sp. TBRC 11911 TaxID=2729386 RepID=UPI00145D0567|nr:2OG-Fe dioxygenase family protein [Actinoplanes sp. TBRC 11911]NMO50537.1 2OG-Fe dioxygenase family protein [Actinoplanes sp. TBRC 11911]
MTTDLAGTGYHHGHLGQILGRDLATDADWAAFADTWNRLLLDEYMADGGTYRYRRYAEFHCDSTGLRPMPHVPYSQSKDVNHLNGGIERWYQPFEPDAAGSPILAGLVRCAVSVLDAAAGPGSWRLRSFQNRIYARSGALGKPTPEGVHRDGVDYVVALLVDRVNVKGGDSSLYTPDRERLTTITLAQPGELILNDDEATRHGVRPLTPGPGQGESFRDVLIAMFTREGRFEESSC